jgi:hypothetical protein
MQMNEPNNATAVIDPPSKKELSSRNGNGDQVPQAIQIVDAQPRVRSAAGLAAREQLVSAYEEGKVYASSDLVPVHFQGKPANCFIAVEIARRINMPVFMVMQHLYVVHGRPGFEAKFVIALVNQSGVFENPLEYEFTGSPSTPEWTCTVSATRKATGKVCALPFKFATAQAEGWVSKSGSKWKTMPDQMMMYRAAAFFTRVYCPEITMGMQTREELEDIGPAGVGALPEGRTTFRPEKALGAESIDTTATELSEPQTAEQRTGETQTTEAAKLAEVNATIKAKQEQAKQQPQTPLALNNYALATFNGFVQEVREVCDVDETAAGEIVDRFIASTGEGRTRASLNDTATRKSIALEGPQGDAWKAFATNE